MNGYKVLEQLRALESTRAVPVLALTANAMPGEDLKALGAGFNEFVTKPIDVPRFDALLTCHLAGREVPRG
ncbi:response regulator [uncultured Piscinibacter sp.]|uniref:response regulator n=1 Tax=uncultured Piscinibacter sp. TaxID=1131835 RepID=UPI0026252CF7|nr:response regulator [uncultured Piscinibacter sp.]